MRKSNRSEWRTPHGFVTWLRRFRLCVDVCATKDNAVYPVYITPEMNALSLSTNWASIARGAQVPTRFYCNPPYHDVLPWIDAARHNTCAVGTVCYMLLHDNFSNKWFTELTQAAREIWLLSPRIEFLPPKGVITSTNGRSSIMAVFYREGGKLASYKETTATILRCDWKNGIIY